MNSVSDPSLRVKITSKQILQIALPISCALLIPNVNFITNNIFLGGLGEKELGNAGTTGVFYLIMMLSGSGLSNGIQSLISRKAGENKIGDIHKIFNQGILIALLFAFGWMLLTWLVAPVFLKQYIKPANFEQEMGFLKIRLWGLPFLYLFQTGNAFLIGTLNSRFMLIGTISEAVVNIFFDYVLIYGVLSFPQLGFNGAAVASVIAEFTGMVIVYIVIFKQGLQTRFKLFQNFSYDKTNSIKILKISAPLVLQYSISLITWLIFFILLEQYGETAKAVSSVMRNVFGIVGVFIWAFASTANTMVSNIIGQNKESEVIHVIYKIMTLSISITIILLSILNVFPFIFLNLFHQSSMFAQQAIPVLYVISVGMLGMSVATIWLNAVTGTGKTRINLYIEIISVILYLMYIYLVMIKWKLSLEIVWANELVYWISVFILAYLYIKSEKWKSGKI